MVNLDLKNSRPELASRLQKLMFLRVLVVSFLLGASIFTQVKETRTYFGDIQTFHYLLIAALYFLTFIYVVFFKIVKDLSKLAYSQLLTDTFFITAIIYSTGGIESIFSFLYILTIINGSIILYRKGGLIIASSSSILYGLLLDLHYYNILHPLGSPLGPSIEYQRTYIFYIIIVNIAAFYCVALLSSYLSEQMRKSQVELEAKQDDISKLEALNEWIIKSITSGLMTLDGQHRVILFNPAAEKILGIRTGQIIGKNVFESLPFLKAYLVDATHPAAQESNHFIDLQHQATNDQTRFIRLSISPLMLSNGDQKGQILIFQDMTEMKKIEEEMKKVEGLALIGELAAGIAHEIRNPMASISGSIQMLRESHNLGDVDTRLMDIILREINRLNHLVNDFLLFARPKSTNLYDIDLNQLITEALELFKNSGKWHHDLSVETDFQSTFSLQSDPEQIKQVLWNIFINAMQAMPNGGTIDVAINANDKFVAIDFEDEGQGIADEVLEKIWDPFFTTKEMGTGLGLGVVKNIIESHGGSIQILNKSQGGACVTVELPVVQP